MDKIKTSKKQKKSSVKLAVHAHGKNIQLLNIKKNIKTSVWNPAAEILNETKLSRALFQCLKEGDLLAFKEILSAHLEAKVKSKSAKNHKLSERTMYEALSEKGNPSLKTISKIVQMAFAA